jgi:sulfoxide reductase heme-binding subunit YedZ
VVLAATLTTNSRALWYLTRGFGLVALILLTLTMVLGLTQIVRFSRPGWPRFVFSALHKNASLVSMVVLAVHIGTAVADSYAPIRVVDVFVPFVGKYRPVWLGLGALAVDFLLALVVTSLLRQRLGHRTWRAVHWAAYACWPVAVLHGLGTGSDTKLGWVLLLNAVCVAAVLAALWWRLANGWSIANATRRGAALVASIGVTLAVVAWAVTGPLRPGWARKAGTPAALIASQGPATSLPAASSPESPSTAAPGGFMLPFTAGFRGSQQQSGANSDGLVSVTISGTFSGAQPGRLSVVLTGQPAGGGVDLTGSQVTLGPSAAPSHYQGHVTQLNGSTLVANLTDAKGNAATVTFQLQIGVGSSAVAGTVTVAS